jgi:hypothetical protein
MYLVVKFMIIVTMQQQHHKDQLQAVQAFINHLLTRMLKHHQEYLNQFVQSLIHLQTKRKSQARTNYLLWDYLIVRQSMKSLEEYVLFCMVKGHFFKTYSLLHNNKQLLFIFQVINRI